MIKLTYQEINKIVNRTKATFYIKGLPEKDCLNTGKQVMYDCNIVDGPESVQIIKHYDTLVLKRDFKKRGFTLTTVLLLFAYYMATFYIFVQMSDDITTTHVETWVAFMLYLLIPAIFYYPYTRKKIFLYQVLGYKVYSLSGVISGLKFLGQNFLVIAIATFLNLIIAHLKGFDLISSFIACMMMAVLILGYQFLIITRMFFNGKGYRHFNHHIKNEGDGSVFTKLRDRYNPAPIIVADEVVKKENLIKDELVDNNELKVIESEDVEVEESTKDLAEITVLMDQILNEEVERAEYEIDEDFNYDEELYEDEEIVLEESQILPIEEIAIVNNVEPTIDELINDVKSKDIETLLSEINGEFIVDSMQDENNNDIYDATTVDEMDQNIADMIGIIDNGEIKIDVELANEEVMEEPIVPENELEERLEEELEIIDNDDIDMNVAPKIDEIVEVEEDVVEDVEPPMELHTEVDARLEEELEIIDNDDIDMNVAPDIDEVVEVEEDVVEDIEPPIELHTELDEQVDQEVDIIDEKLS